MQPADIFNVEFKPDELRIVPLGGCGEFGMNLTCYIHAGRLFVVDAGVRFPDSTKLGVDAIIPQVEAFFDQAGGPYSYIITHGHEDHIGALPHLLERWPAPVYATAWTLGLIRKRMHRLERDYEDLLNEVAAGDTVAVDDFSAEYVHINHSIPMACALMVRTKAGNVFHTGDFKLDPDPMEEAPFNQGQLKKLGKEGVQLLLADSTNAHKPGRCPSEKTVFKPLKKLVQSADSAVIVTTFSSNYFRLKTLVEVAVATKRKLLLCGAGVEATLSLAAQLGHYRVPEGVIIGDSEARTLPRDKLLVVATGCQGEGRAALARIAFDEYKAFKIQPGDLVIHSARVIPGNERTLFYMFDKLKRAGAKILTQRDHNDIHVSGHAYRQDLDLLVQYLQPENLVPIHGSYTHLDANFTGFRKAARKSAEVHLIEDGDCLVMTSGQVIKTDGFETETSYVDGDSAAPMTYEQMRQRLRVGEQGAVILTGVYSRKKRSWVVDPELEFIGLPLPTGIEPDNWQKEACQYMQRELADAFAQKADDDEVREMARINIRRQLNKLLRKKPVVFAKLQMVSE